MRIDAHQHFWKYDPVRDAWITDEMHVIKRDFLPEHLEGLLHAHNLQGCIAVQADQSEHETQFLLALAAQHDFIKGVVGWVDLRAANLEERLAYFSGFPRLKGFRHIVQGEPEGFLRAPGFINGVRKLPQYGFSYDLLLYHYQLNEALAFVEEVGEVNIIVDHLAKPSIRTKEHRDWEEKITALARFENVSCKISGMVTEAVLNNWKQEDFIPYLDTVVNVFGTDRLLYGSDWPVCLLSASYQEQLDIVKEYFSSFPAGEQANVMGGNAVRIYRL